MDEAGFQGSSRARWPTSCAASARSASTSPGDGEYGKAMGSRVNYGAWWSYSFQRLGGLELTGLGLYDLPARRSEPGNVVLTSFGDRRDRVALRRGLRRSRLGHHHRAPAPRQWPVCTGPVTYIGQELIAADIANFRAALARRRRGRRAS